MLRTSENTVPEWTRALNDLAFPSKESFCTFLSSVGVSAEQLEFDPVRGEATVPNDLYSVYSRAGIQLTGHGVELLHQATQQDLKTVLTAALKAGAKSEQLARDSYSYREESGYGAAEFGPFFDRAPTALRDANLAPVEKKESSSRAPTTFEDILDSPAETGADFLSHRAGLDPNSSLVDLANRELGRRQLHLRALTEAMNEAGFPNYNAQEAFFLACICTDQVTHSEPIITSSTRVASLSGYSASTLPTASTLRKDPYAYFDPNIFGYSFSFGFTQIAHLNQVTNRRSLSACLPIIGIDERLLQTIVKLEEKSGDAHSSPKELFAHAIRFIWTASTLAGHDHVHALVTDLAENFPDAPFAKGGLTKTLASIRERYPEFGNETHATLMQGASFKVIFARNPDVRAAVFRQAIQYLDNVARLSEHGLPNKATAHLLYVGFAHIQVIIPLDEVFAGNDSKSIMEYAEDRFPALEKNRTLTKMRTRLGLKPLAFAEVSLDLSPPLKLRPISDLSFADPVRKYTPSHYHYMFRLLDELHTACKEFAATNRDKYPQFQGLDRQTTFKSEELPGKTAEQPAVSKPPSLLHKSIARARHLVGAMKS